MTRIFCLSVLAAALATCVSTAVLADPIDGRDILKFRQRPMFNTPIPSGPGQVEFFHGHDELSTAYRQTNAAGEVVYQGRFMADDFADRFSSPVVHVKWWGSYMHRPTNLPDARVPRFLISFEEDVPVSSTNPFSHPGEPLLNQIVRRDADGVLTPGSGTFTEKLFWPTSVDGPIFEYNAELHLGKEFFQKPDEVYWLKIVALVDPIAGLPLEEQLRWGWHNRDYTIRDPLASVPPAVVPGEHLQGLLPTPGGPIPVWHFQDDAVDGFVRIEFDENDPLGRFMPTVTQDVGSPQHYLPPFDGPSLIGQFSKDLAFELYTIPEPSCFILVALAGCTLVLRGRRQRRKTTAAAA